MTTAEMEALVEHKLGLRRHGVARELGILADRLQPGERLVTVAVASPELLLGGGCLVAATDRRLLLISPSLSFDELEYADLIWVTYDEPSGEIALVTRDGAHTLTVLPSSHAADIVAAVASQIGHERIGAPAGADDARRMRRALVGVIVGACALGAGYVSSATLRSSGDAPDASRQAPSDLSKGQCLDAQGRRLSCRSGRALFVVLGPRDMPRCSAASPTLAKSLGGTQAARRELSRWCIGLRGTPG